MCMAMMNSVTFKAPRCSVSERFQMRPRTSLGNRAFSKISFAFSPEDVRESPYSHIKIHTRQHAIDGPRLLEEACVFSSLGRY